jgi:hypothetical protein
MRIFSRQGALVASKDMAKCHHSYVIFDDAGGVGSPEHRADEKVVERRASRKMKQKTPPYQVVSFLARGVFLIYWYTHDLLLGKETHYTIYLSQKSKLEHKVSKISQLLSKIRYSKQCQGLAIT